MRYIKKFENSSQDFKKYIICQGEDRVDDKYYYLALEILDKINDFEINVKTLAFSRRDYEVRTSAELKALIKSLESKVIFQSDDIEEIRTRLELLKTTDKYNL